ncbi:RNA polymerase-associated protein RapA [bacterium]|nr:RNA polymerase-associated protein RapA [bacterium]
MTTTQFVAGQRWVSNTESELGLGIVIETASRRVELSFPAAGERRTYAMSGAPLNRVRYEAGKEVETESGEVLVISEVLEHNGCFIYSCTNEQGDSVVLPEIDLNSFVQFSKPQDRLFAGQIDKNRAFQLRCSTLEHIRYQQQSSVRGLLGPRVQLLPHQLYIANEAANRYAPRVLLADEVGLGKTIEAGLILHQQLIQGLAKRVLIVVPDSLLHQWLIEMLRRFNLAFTILDEERCQGIEGLSLDDELGFDLEDELEPAQNPFESTQLVLCTLSFLAGNTERQQQALAADWDLLIVDEAHHLQWSESEVSAEYQAIELLAQQTKGLLLLTATPEQLGVASHFARLRLLDPDRYHDLSAFIDEEKQHQPVNELVQQLLADDVFDVMINQSQQLDELGHYLDEQALSALRSSLDEQDSDAFQHAIEDVIRNLLDQHGTGRVLFRNTRSSVTGFPERRLNSYELDAPSFYSRDDSLDALLAPELSLPDEWLSEDPRVEWLVDWLKQHRDEKVLIICARAKTALQLEEHLRVWEGWSSSVFHEGLSLVARDRAAAYFADDEDGAQVLVCSEIGSEGRNFQFSHHLVLFDLPTNPDLLEQRIGRLDRIGQRHTVDIHVPVYRDSAQTVLLQWYHQGINAFEQTCPAGLVLYNEFKAELHHCLQHGDDSEALAKLIASTAERTAQLIAQLQNGRDRLLELNSCNEQRADEIVEQMVEDERRQELSQYMEHVFDQFGVDQEHHSASSIILRPSDHMLHHSFPGLPEEGLTATYSREVALSREDMSFLSWEHPMVIGAMDMVLNGDFGNTTFCTIKLPIAPGTILLEAVFVTHCSAPSELQIHRYLPLTTTRVVMDSNGNNLTKVLTAQHFDKLGEKVAKRSAQELVAHARDQISKMVTKAEDVAELQREDIIAEAVAIIEHEQQGELQRLKALSQVNKNIRQEEIDFQQQLGEQLRQALQHTQIKLDAIRVALVVA